MTRYGGYVAFLMVATWLVLAGADDSCGSCDNPAFPEATAFLEAKGYSAEQFSVLLAWREAAPSKKNVLINGYHVLPKVGGELFPAHDGTAPFDLYSDAAGNLLDELGLAALGVRPKNWDLKPIEQQSEMPPPLAKSLPPRPVPVGVAAKMAPSASLQLPPVDLDALLLEDEAAEMAPDKGPKRIGIVRPLLEPILVTEADPGIGSWRLLPDGRRLWTVTLGSPGATALRVHFAQLAVPAGGQVLVYNPACPGEAYGPYTAPYAGDNGLWTASVFADSVTIECCLPAEGDSGDLLFLIDEVAHTYAGFDVFQWTETQEKAAAGACNHDVSCFPDWSATARGVAGFAFISNLNVLHCTGALVADTDPSTSVPYFLTANHCVSVQDGTVGASSMEFFWLYQTDTCNGVAPALSSVPRTAGGADFLAGASSTVGSDFALVRLRNAPPDGLTYIGWSSVPIAIGTNVAVIHHPSGDYKRISFGTLIDTGSPQAGNTALKPLDFFNQSLWNLGTTEPTSSGSPLMLADQQLIIGQLWGGYASCSLPNEPDYFGRFDKTFPLIQQWIDPNPYPTDVDRSGVVDSVDLQISINAVLGKTTFYNADVNNSGTVDAIDVQLIILAILNG